MAHHSSSSTRAPARRPKLIKASIAFAVAMLLAARAAASPDASASGDAFEWSIGVNAPTRLDDSAEIHPPLLPAAPMRTADSRAIPPQERLPLGAGASGGARRSLATAGPSQASTAEGDADGAGDPGTATTRDSSSAPSTATTWTSAIWQGFEALPIAAILGALAVAAIVLRAASGRQFRGGHRPDGVIEIMARFPMGRGQQIVLLRVGRRVIVAHQADRTMRTLAETNDPEETAELIEKSRSAGGDLFSRLLERRRGEVDPFAQAELVDLTRERGRPR